MIKLRHCQQKKTQLNHISSHEMINLRIRAATFLVSMVRDIIANLAAIQLNHAIPSISPESHVTRTKDATFAFFLPATLAVAFIVDHCS
jgi:tRNA U38,U39,U40 pseudouridine synthase TruA